MIIGDKSYGVSSIFLLYGKSDKNHPKQISEQQEKLENTDGSNQEKEGVVALCTAAVPLTRPKGYRYNERNELTERIRARYYSPVVAGFYRKIPIAGTD